MSSVDRLDMGHLHSMSMAVQPESPILRVETRLLEDTNLNFMSPGWDEDIYFQLLIRIFLSLAYR
jgi:hypothetical protein